MGYREVGQMEIREVIRRWQAGESRRAMARATGLSRTTVDRYLGQAKAAGVVQGSGPPGEAVLRSLAQESQSGPVVGQRGGQMERLRPQAEQVQRWLQQDRLQLTRVQELLAQQGVAVAYTTLRRFVAQAGLKSVVRSTVRMADTAPGEVAEMDFGRLGPLTEHTTGERLQLWALVVVLSYSRHSFVWPLEQQTLAAVIEGLEASWRFFAGIPQRLVLDNFPAAVAGPDALAPRLTRGMLEYSQARGLLIDPARVRHPRDKECASHCTSSS